jgi:hypothetical protein
LRVGQITAVSIHSSIILTGQAICPSPGSTALPGTVNTRQFKIVLITGPIPCSPFTHPAVWDFFTRYDQAFATLIKPVKEVDHFRQRAAWSTFIFNSVKSTFNPLTERFLYIFFAVVENCFFKTIIHLSKNVYIHAKDKV